MSDGDKAVHADRDGTDRRRAVPAGGALCRSGSIFLRRTGPADGGGRRLRQRGERKKTGTFKVCRAITVGVAR